MRRARVLLACVGAALILNGCGGELQTPGEALRIFDSSLPEAFVGEQYEAQVRAVGGLRPFTFGLEEGALPPGLDLEAGVIRGIPTETGNFTFTIAVSDANLSRTFEEYSLGVVERPPPRLSLVAPATEIRAPTTVRLRVANASELRAVSVVVGWDAGRFELVEGSVESEASGTALLWQSEPGSLQLDVAALGRAWNGEVALIRFDLAPTAPNVLQTTLEATFLDDRGGSNYQGAGPRVAPGEQDDAEAADEELAGDEPIGNDPIDDEPIGDEPIDEEPRDEEDPADPGDPVENEEDSQ
ncbi:MAG: putative Ig domain-containing protein [Trueperaceae bacterium]